ncbi:MAG: HlyD family efflux transporter periplasmic adaptor subunit [Pirellulaceae bacterium]
MAAHNQSSSVDPETIAKTKQQIRALVEEIAQLTKSGIAAEAFYAEYLQRLVTALAAVGGAIWLKGEGGALELAYQINLSSALVQEASPEQASEDAVRHLRLIEHIARIREAKLVPPHSGSGDEQIGNPTRFLLVISPLTSDDGVEGVVEIFQRPDSQPDTQRGYLRFLSQMADLAGDWLRAQKLKNFRDRQSMWVRADNFARQVHESLDKKLTAYAIANEGRRLIECDRVSVAILKGRKCYIQAISGQDTIEHRSNTVAALGNLATRVCASGESLWYLGSTEDMPPQIEDAVQHYVEESFTKTLAVIPLRELTADIELDERHEDGRVTEEHELQGEVIGAMIVEQIEGDLPREVLEPRIDLVYMHSARALANALQYNNLFLMPVWRTLGRASFVLRARTLPKTLAIAAAVVAVILALIFVPSSFDLEARGALQPKIKRDVFAGVDGVVTNVLVDHGDIVEKGQVLLEMENTDLEVQITELVGQKASVEAQLQAVASALSRGRQQSEDEHQQLLMEKSQLTGRRDSIDLQLALLNTKRSELQVRSPIAGEVVTWSVDQKLLHRPVRVGEVLLGVVDPEDEWELEIFMPGQRMGHLDAAFDELAADGTLDVTYILATDPSAQLEGEVRREDIHDVTEMHEEEGNTTRIRVQIDKQDLSDPRPGSTVIADIHCGTRPIGYVWFHEGVEWVQKTLFYYF